MTDDEFLARLNAPEVMRPARRRPAVEAARPSDVPTEEELELFLRQLRGEAPIPRRRGTSLREDRGGHGRARQSLAECCQQSGLDVDEAAGVVKGVKVLGLRSANGRRYLPEAARAGLSLYEGRVVNIDHPPKPGESRSYKDRFGRLADVRIAGDGGIAATLKYNPHHGEARAFAWWAKNDPTAIGLSHNAVGEGVVDDTGVFVVESIVEVRSVDVVADPATTGGLFESVGRRHRR